MTASFPRLQTPRAVRAVRAILADPDDLPQVFTLLESLGGDTLPRMRRRLSRSEAGRRLLATRPDIVPQLEDHATLRALPSGTLGRAYLAFLESENISAAGIKEAAERGQMHNDELPEAEGYLHRRMRDTHDLWHAVTGYRGDVLGEIALLGFTFAQTWNPGIGILVGVGLYKTQQASEARALILDGFQRGRRAAWLPEQPWETMLALPLDQVRRKLGVGAPPGYTPVRSSELRAAAA